MKKSLVIAILSLTSAAAMSYGIWQQSLNVLQKCEDQLIQSELEQQIVVMQRRIDTLQRQIDLHQCPDTIQVAAAPYTELEYDSAAVPLYDIKLSEDLQKYTWALCYVYGIVDYYDLVLAVMWHESLFDANAISGTGDYGLMQINECNHTHLQEVLGVDDFLDPYDNIESGVYILSGLIHKYQSVEESLMAYNMGPGTASKLWARGIYATDYVENVASKLVMLQNAKKK